MTLAPGSKLGPYEIQAPLGAGGMGEVYRARDTRLDRIVAVKILPAHLADDSGARERFDREARAVSSLNHPNICHLYDVGAQDRIRFLVMEYLEGETLANRLLKGALPLEQLLRYGIDICEGLEKAHRGGVVHRDLKPSNIMLTKAGTKLMDFGLAKAAVNPVGGSTPALLATLSQPLTEQGMVVGTFQYMAPEQLEGKEADTRSDIFALGAVIYEMATGTRAFEGKTTASVIAAVLGRDPEPISTVQPMSPPFLDDVVKTCVAKDPEERWQSARDVRLQLEWIARGGLQTRTPLPRPHKLAWGVAALCALAALALSIGLLLRAPKPIAARQIRFSVIPPDEASVSTGSLAISPDGHSLVFGAAGSLWVRSLDTLSPRRLEGTSGALYPFWSPDHRFVGFLANGKLEKISPTGVNAPEEVCNAARGATGASWNQEGIILFSVDGKGIFRVSASGGDTPVPVTTLDLTLKETNHWWPYFLPDGRHFLYLAETNEPQQGRTVYVASLDSRQRVRLMNADSKVAYSETGYLFFLRNRALLAQAFDVKHLRLSGDPFLIVQQLEYIRQWGDASFAVSQNGVLTYISGEFHSSLVWFDRTGREIGRVGQPAEYVHVELSPVGERAAVEIIDPNTKAGAVWLIDLKRGISSRFTFNPAWEYFPIWSPDGSRILFDSSRDFGTSNGSNGNLFIKSSTGADKEELLLKSELWKWPNDWSRDGRYILFHSLDPQTKADLWVLPLFGDRTPQVFLQTEFSEEFGQFSPDGHFIAYVSDESGRNEVYIRPFPASDSKWQVSSNGGQDIRWRHDGKELLYEAPDGKLMSVKLKLSPTFQAEKPEPLFNPHFGDRMRRHQYALSADGERILAIVRNEILPITVVSNWSRDLEQK